MTPQESELVNALFDRLANIENAPRDAAAERLIEDGARRAPHALYALVQTVLLQDEGLKRANARIEELQAQAAEGAAQEQGQGQGQGSFLDSMREAFAPHEPRGSVPSVRAAGTASGGTAPEMAPPREYPPQMPPTPGYGAPPPGAGGGSFLGPAASTAAGMIGGALLLDGIRSMFGHRAGAADANAFGGLTGGNTSGSTVDSDLARAAGVDDIDDAARRDRDKPLRLTPTTAQAPIRPRMRTRTPMLLSTVRPLTATISTTRMIRVSATTTSILTMTVTTTVTTSDSAFDLY